MPCCDALKIPNNNILFIYRLEDPAQERHPGIPSNIIKEIWHKN